MKEWLDLGYDPETYAHRSLVVDLILSRSPKTVLDVGCGNGSDIALLRLRKPGLVLSGVSQIDGEVCKERNPGADVTIGLLEEYLPTVPDKSIDVVFSNGCIMYSSPKWVDHMIRIAKKAVVLSEQDEDSKIRNHLSEAGIQFSSTPVSREIRPSWVNKGYILEIHL